ncbi:MAG: zinc ABC transporter substrate-binding protein, partial [Caldilineaceae bacterium]|nr:zinc ABC transporter substrate-binding protein [Caldilineaceae bacterium]
MAVNIHRKGVLRSIVGIALLSLAAIILAACGSSSQAAGDGRLRVVATTGQIGDIVKNVGGDYVEVTALMGPGVDPHLFVASEGDVDLLQRADVIFYNGLFLEAQMADILHQIGERKPSIAVAESIDEAKLLPWVGKGDEYDPHVWFDVTLWQQAVATVRDTLATVDAEHADAYRANAASYLEQLDDLHAYVQERAAQVPAGQRVLITAHDAFHYFGRAYGFEVRGLQGISTASEAGTADVRELADYIAENRISAIFIETSVPVRNIEALQAAVADRGFSVKIGGELYSDALGSPDSEGATYIGMVKHNVDTIVDA